MREGESMRQSYPLKEVSYEVLARHLKGEGEIKFLGGAFHGELWGSYKGCYVQTFPSIEREKEIVLEVSNEDRNRRESVFKELEAVLLGNQQI